jgi:hypothetical protein
MFIEKRKEDIGKKMRLKDSRIYCCMDGQHINIIHTLHVRHLFFNRNYFCFHLPRREIGLGFKDEQKYHGGQGKVRQDRTSSIAFQQIGGDFAVHVHMSGPWSTNHFGGKNSLVSKN